MSSIPLPHSDVSTSQLGKKSPHFKWASGPFLMQQEFKNSNTHNDVRASGCLSRAISVPAHICISVWLHQERPLSPWRRCPSLRCVRSRCTCDCFLFVSPSASPSIQRKAGPWHSDDAYLLFFFLFRRMPAGTCSVTYNTHLAQTHSFVINSCPHL